ncbi:hypothetical protein NESM_000500200 [Novymonas esmeraldas]|uniref:SET domain-containing protein n=1 Tax=Novymonas esmeraldas TaxID=1808958 RepID=A0AAW0EPQ9_9TRYP
MILVFYISDSLGRRHRFSVVCGPSTTAVGAINQLRTRLSIPTEVEVEVHLSHNVLIRHVTSPLTSLRKQRRGTAQVLRMALWAVLRGPDSAVNEIDYSAADVLEDGGEEEEEEDEDEEWDGASRGSSYTPSHHCNGAAGSSASGGHSTRIVFAGPPVKGSAVPVQAKAPAAAVPPRPHHTPSSARFATPESVENRRTSSPPPSDSRRRTPTSTPTPPPVRTTTSPAPPPSLVIKRRSAADATAAATPQPLTARGPPRRPPVELSRHTDEAPQTARAVSRPPAAIASAALPHAVAVGSAQAHRNAGYAHRDATLGHIMLREYPKVVPRDSKDIVLSVKDDVRLAENSFNPDFTATSDVDGVADSAYAQWLSIGLTHGQELRASDSAAAPLLALYGEMSSLRHSCSPNSVVQYDLFTAPYAGSCRCAQFDGIRNGEPITHLYKHVDSLAFLLLSRERRRNMLRRRYFFECGCARCTETLENTISAADVQAPGAPASSSSAAAAADARVTSAEADAGTGSETIYKKRRAGRPSTAKVATRTRAQLEAEATLTGAFFTNSSVDRDAAKQRALAQEMQTDFESLQVMDDTGTEINLTLAGNVPPIQRTKQCNRLLGFLRKYGSSESVLRLHEHHWRLNLVRAAYVQETVRLCAVKGATPEARQREPNSKTLFTPTKTVYDVCLKQLAAESLFIPAGHPHSLTTYESYLYLVAILPPALAQTAQRSAQSVSNIRWTQLQQTKEAWGVLKRAALPPQIQRIVELKEQTQSPSPTSTPPPAPAGAAAASTTRALVEQEVQPKKTSVKVPPSSRKVSTRSTS